MRFDDTKRKLGWRPYLLNPDDVLTQRLEWRAAFSGRDRYREGPSYMFSSFSQAQSVKRIVCMNPMSSLLHIRIFYHTTNPFGRV